MGLNTLVDYLSRLCCLDLLYFAFSDGPYAVDFLLVFLQVLINLPTLTNQTIQFLFIPGSDVADFLHSFFHLSVVVCQSVDSNMDNNITPGFFAKKYCPIAMQIYNIIFLRYNFRLLFDDLSNDDVTEPVKTLHDVIIRGSKRCSKIKLTKHGRMIHQLKAMILEISNTKLFLNCDVIT